VTAGATVTGPGGPPTTDAPRIALVPDRPHASPGAGRTATATHRLPPGTAGAVRAGARFHAVAEAALWRAALLTVLHRHTGQTDLALGSGPELLRVDLGDGPRFADLVARCGADPGPHLRVRLALRSPDGGAPDGAADLDVEVGAADLTARFPPDLFDADRIERLLGHVAAALRSGLACPTARVDDLDVLAPAERDRVLRDWQPRPVPAPAGLLHDVIAGRDPHRVAVRLGRTELTYGELERRANRLAHALRGQGIGAGDVVGLLLDRGLHLPIAQLAVMRAGAAWLPLDPQQPPARLGFLAADSATALVLTSRALADHARAAAPDLPRWHLDDPGWATTIEHLPATAPDVDISPDDPAYLLYTSGSTGTPKGVLVPHRCARHYCTTAVQMYRTTPDDRVAQASNPAFDASIFDTYATFLAGATLIAAPSATIADPTAFTALIRTQQVTLSFIPPAVLALLDPDDLATTTLRGIFSAGEALPPQQATRWARAGLELHNSYGPTETTVVVTDHICTDKPLTGPTPIGTALRNHRAYALDDRLHPVPIGVPGQLFIAGPGVTYGYHARPALTAERFLPDPHGAPGERMYATGDIVRWRADGLLEFLGRRDRQIQLRGQRIELGEIEHTLGRHPDVRQCAVVLRDETLVGYLVGSVGGDRGVDLDQVRGHLADRLPPYMIPTTLVTVPELPLTPNGKLDVARLPAPAPAVAEYVAPRTDTERWLATVWQDLLGVDRVGVRDNFFDLGGNSLHATRLIARIRVHHGTEVHLQHLFTSPTLGQLAGRIDEVRDHARDDRDDNVAAPTRTPLITLRPRGIRPPLFLVHPVGGSVTAYARLAPLLGDDRPVHAIEDPALYGATPPGSLVERARRYADLVRRVQQAGPYHIGGWSLGGLIGLEMARELSGAGETVALVVALDSGLPLVPSHPSEVELLTAFVHDLAGIAGVAPPDIDFDFDLGDDRDALAERTLDRLADVGLAPAELRDELRVRMGVFADNLRAMAAHRVSRYDGRVAVIRAADEPRAGNDAAWPALVADLVRHTVPGNHFTMLAPPHLSTLAATLREVLR
jgi:amino acid adenylation domain-containing protein